MKASALVERVGILRCNQIACPAVYRFTYSGAAERRAVLAANCARPWRCDRHEQAQRDVSAGVDIAGYGTQQLGMVA